MIQWLGYAYKVGDHVIGVSPEGKIGACDCPDYEMRKRVHNGWCKHRLAIAIRTGKTGIVKAIEGMNSRLDAARRLAG